MKTSENYIEQVDGISVSISITKEGLINVHANAQTATSVNEEGIITEPSNVSFRLTRAAGETNFQLYDEKLREKFPQTIAAIEAKAIEIFEISGFNN